MSRFCLLDDSQPYVAHDWDLTSDETSLKHWLGLFRAHFDETLQQALSYYGRSAAKQIEAARTEFVETIERLERDPASLPSGKLNVMELCRLRQDVLWSHKLRDPFAAVKRRENESALELYPQVIRKARALDPQDRWLCLVQGVFAGNIFDLGSPATTKLSGPSPDFYATLEQIRPRPWLVDDFDELSADLDTSPPSKWSKAVVFVDNCGTDFILGLMPFVRELALEGTQIVLAANEKPSLNDLTADETADLVERLAGLDPDLTALVDAGMFEVVSTGNDLPLIDLCDVSDELNEASADAELVLLEGMGRAVESNFDAAFTTDALRLALLKDPLVAKRVGGEVYDCICKYTRRTGA